MAVIRTKYFVSAGLIAVLAGCATPREEPAPVIVAEVERAVPIIGQKRLQRFGAVPLIRNIQAGPISDHADAGRTCTQLADKVGGTWTGVWNTTEPGEMSVCEILQGKDPALAGTIYEQVEQAPKPVFSPDPPYTSDAKAEGVEGRVTVSYIVGQSGDVRDVKVINGLEPNLDQSVLDTVKTWRFTPGLEGGRVVAVRETRSIRFELDRLFEDGTERLFFDAVRFELTARQKVALDKTAAHLVKTDAAADITGHTNITGTRADNLALAARRAAGVKAYLVERGVAAEKLETISMGEERPAVAGTGPDVDAKNDRVEIKLLKTARPPA